MNVIMELDLKIAFTWFHYISAHLRLCVTLNSVCEVVHGDMDSSAQVCTAALQHTRTINYPKNVSQILNIQGQNPNFTHSFWVF